MLNLIRVCDGNLVRPFPHMTSLDTFPSQVTPAQRLIALAEQYLFAYYLCEADRTPLVQEFLDRVKMAVLALPSESVDRIEGARYRQYHQTAVSLVTKTPDRWFGLDNLLADTHTLGEEHRIMTPAFYEPLLYSLSGVLPRGRDEQAVYSAQLYTPKLYVEQGKLFLTRQVVPFTEFTCRRMPELRVANGGVFYAHLARFSWSGQPFGRLVDLLAKFHLDKTRRSHTSIPAACHAGIWGAQSPIVSQRQPCQDFMRLVHYLDSQYRIDVSNLRLVGRYLRDVGRYEGAEWLTSDYSSLEDREQFAQHPELQFLLSRRDLLRPGTEAAEPESTSNEDETPSGDNDIDTTAPEAGGASSAAADDVDLGGADEGGDDLGGDFGGDMSGGLGDTSGGGYGDDSGNDKAKVTDTDTPPDADDPLAIRFIISNEETIDDTLFRRRAIKAIQAILGNPPKAASYEDLAFLKVWLTEWINVASADTTRDILTKLSSRIISLK